MSEQPVAPPVDAIDPRLAYEAKSDRLKAIAKRMGEIIEAVESIEDKESQQAAALMEEKIQLDAELFDFLNEVCGAYRDTPNGGQVACSRSTAHPDDHFDEIVGIGWQNENETTASLARDPVLDAMLTDMVVKNADQITAYVDGLREQLHRTHAALDRVGVPRDRLENTLTLVHRTNLFVDRLSKRLHGQVENNMALYNAIRDALTSLVGSPNASSLPIKSAIERLRGVLPSKKSPGGIHLQ